MLVQLDDAQARHVEFVKQCFHTRGLSGARIAIQKHVVGGLAFQKRLGIRQQLLLLQFESHQIRQADVVQVVDGHEFESAALHGNKRSGLFLAAANTAFVLADAERAVQPECAHTVGSVGIAHDLVERTGIFCGGKAIANRADNIRHAAVIAHPILGNGLVVAHQAQKPGSQLLFHVGEVEGKQLAEYLEVRQGDSGDAPLLDPSAFGGKREGILVGQKHEGQVALPKVPIEGISRRHVEQVLHLHVHHREQ